MYYLNSAEARPLYDQLYRQMVTQIRAGELTGRLDSIRSLATELQVSKGTVENAYELLVAEDWIENRPQQGFFVRRRAELSDVSEHDQDLAQPDFDFSLQYASSMLETHAKTAWKRSLNQAIQSQFDRRAKTAIRRQGSWELREEIVKLLARQRGIHTTAAQVVVTTGSTESLTVVTQLARAYLQEPLSVGIEDPGYRNGYETLKRQSVTLRPIPVTAQAGIQLDQLAQQAVNLVYVTPSHQFPLGATMSLARRKNLLQLMAAKTGLVIEDDYDSEFSVKSKPVPALKALDDERVVYLSGFSKTISSDLRLSFIVLPEKMLPTYRRLFAYESSSVSYIAQAATTDFLRSGAYSRHIRRALQLNRQKYVFLQQQLTPFVTSGLITARFGEAGIHTVFHLTNPQNCQPFEAALAQQRLYLRPMDRCWFTRIQPGYYIIGFAHFSQADFNRGLQKLVTILKTLAD